MDAKGKESWTFAQSGFAQLIDVKSIQKGNCRRQFGPDECFLFGDHEVTLIPQH
jgi:hypothetical protein